MSVISLFRMQKLAILWILCTVLLIHAQTDQPIAEMEDPCKFCANGQPLKEPRKITDRSCRNAGGNEVDGVESKWKEGGGTLGTGDSKGEIDPGYAHVCKEAGGSVFESDCNSRVIAANSIGASGWSCDGIFEYRKVCACVGDPEPAPEPAPAPAPAPNDEPVAEMKAPCMFCENGQILKEPWKITDRPCRDKDGKELDEVESKWKQNGGSLGTGDAKGEIDPGYAAACIEAGGSVFESDCNSRVIAANSIGASGWSCDGIFEYRKICECIDPYTNGAEPTKVNLLQKTQAPTGEADGAPHQGVVSLLSLLLVAVYNLKERE